MRNIIYAPQTNMQVVFSGAKAARQRRRITGLFRLHALPMTSGEKLSETLSDPLHRKPAAILRQNRIEASIYGRARGMIRPAAPQQVAWKYPIWNTQKNVRPIGPYNQQVQKSVLGRLSSFLDQVGSNGG